MADSTLEHDIGMHPWAPSLPLEMLEQDSSLVDYDGTPAASPTLHVDGASHLEVFVEVAVEAGQKVVLSFEAKWESTDDWYASWDGDNASVGIETFVFDATGRFAILVDTSTRQVRARYGYRGGTGAAPASLTLTVVGKRAF